MPRVLPLDPVTGAELRRVAGAARTFKTRYPKRSVPTLASQRAALRRWQRSVPEPKPPKNPVVRVRAVTPTATSLSKLREVFKSDAAPTEALNQRLTPDVLAGTLYSAIAAYEFMKLESEYKRRKSSRRASGSVEEQWGQVVAAAQLAFKAGGLKASPSDLSRYARTVASSRSTLETIAGLANTAVVVGAAGGLTGKGGKPYYTIIPDVERYLDLSQIVIDVPGLCDTPIAEGHYSKHFSRSVSLCVSITVWCPTWSNPFRTCTKKICIGASFSLTLDVGYKVNCCGASAWGVAAAQACVSILGKSFCASCTAAVTGVSGIARTPTTGGSCAYGIGVVASLTCKFGGFTIFSASVPYGWTVTGPCPPPGACA